MSEISKIVPVDIEFQDLNYVIKGRSVKRVLKSINGNFYSGELTAILGASGSGKTTLLNILAGYISTGVTGSIKVNGTPRNMKTFHKLAAYIMQDDLLQPFLNVEEMMMIAAKLKLGDLKSTEEKSATVNEVLTLLGLEKCLGIRTEELSKGQKKRLSVALEMVSNPPVIFLDEPTSGMDTVSAKQCLNTFQTLTKQGKTVICTIHQPSASMLQQFDQVYFIHDGLCVYNGSMTNIIPFLSTLGYECPVTYSPADYIVETVQTVQDSALALSEGIQNGKTNQRDLLKESLSSLLPRLPFSIDEDIDVPIIDAHFPTTFWSQFYILSSRMFLQLKRNKMEIWLQVFNHAVATLIFVLLYYGIGNNADKIVFTYHYFISTLIFFLYTYTMLPVVLFPTELQLLKREYFNRWYDLKPYFLALTLRGLPLMVLLGLAFTSTTYVFTNQPIELYRFVWFSAVCILTAIASEGLGMTIGSVCNLMNGSMLASCIIAALILFCIHGAGYGSQISPIMKVIMHFSYLRVGIVAISNAMFRNRDSMDCVDKQYCYYQDPKRFLQDLGVDNTPCSLYISCLIVFVVVFKASGFLALKYRLTSEFSKIIVNYTYKVFRHR
ncbi:hypothetical protein ILUMI_11847 [Ignelater luminosus]|uniref:ABC transporter domain-containing protein n=1 Tax=Ignelater luminosus TaxID=2038154 RepID=A0A8K0CVG8_IGNLU|nr:hypothetical protein ILUMI_11847 [Ignelater luminosus]